jgi:hypothetical protein
MITGNTKANATAAINAVRARIRRVGWNSDTVTIIPAWSDGPQINVTVAHAVNVRDQHDLITDIYNALDRTPLTSAVIRLKTVGIPDELGTVDGKMIALSSGSEHHWAVDAH